LCQSPSEMDGSFKPLRPHRLYFIESYLVSEAA
jgi:hypothetical protein